MDITFKGKNCKFNYRVCAIIIKAGKLLAMQDECSPYYYLPGGRVKMGETAEDAILRELKEELQTDAKIIRPLWLNQGFFTEDTDGQKYHELCLYFLIEADSLSLPLDTFILHEGVHTHKFFWIPFESLKDEYLYPQFIKESIFHLPKSLELRTEYE